jgi:hypothetical protein
VSSGLETFVFVDNLLNSSPVLDLSRDTKSSPLYTAVNVS